MEILLIFSVLLSYYIFTKVFQKKQLFSNMISYNISKTFLFLVIPSVFTISMSAYSYMQIDVKNVVWCGFKCLMLMIQTVVSTVLSNFLGDVMIGYAVEDAIFNVLFIFLLTSFPFLTTSTRLLVCEFKSDGSVVDDVGDDCDLVRTRCWSECFFLICWFWWVVQISYKLHI